MRASCTICSDLFDNVNTIIATPCGHVFHELCCMQWMEHSKTCPACRQKMTAKSVVKLYFTQAEDSILVEDDSKLRNELETLKTNLKVKEMENRKQDQRMGDLREAVKKAEDLANSNQQKYLEFQYLLTNERLQVKQLVKENSNMEKTVDENKKLLKQLHHLKNVQSIIDSCQTGVDEVLTNWGGGISTAAKETATYITLLKRELQNCRESRSKLSSELRGIKYDLGLKSSQLKEKEKELQNVKSELGFLREALDGLELDKGHKTPMSASKRKFTSPETTPKENLPTPFKRPKISMVSAMVSLVQEKDKPVPKLPQTTISFSEENLFRLRKEIEDADKSIISEGYNGLGGHTKFVSKSAPLKMKFTSLHKKPASKKTVSNPKLDRFLSL